MSIIRKIAYVLTLIGALNWGLVGVANFDLVAALLGVGLLANVVYTLVGLSALWLIFAPKGEN